MLLKIRISGRNYLEIQGRNWYNEHTKFYL